MMKRCVELQETVQQLFQIILGVYLLLQYHLQHRLPEVQIRVVGVFLHRHGLPPDPTEPSNGSRLLGCPRVPAVMMMRDVNVIVRVGRECGGAVVIIVFA